MLRSNGLNSVTPKIRVLKLKNSKLNKEDKSLLLFILMPVVIYIFGLQGINFLWAAILSLTSEAIRGIGDFIGFKNYINLFKDSIYQDTMLFTLIYVVGTIIPKLLLGLLMALTLNKPLKGQNIYRSLLFLPWALPTFTSALTWKWMFSDIGGVFNYILMKVGFIDRPIGWLGTITLARISVITVNIWRGFPFFGITILAALQSIPNNLYEVAEIDGASSWKSFLYITLPSIKSVVILVSLISAIWTIGDFSLIWLMTRGGPINSTHVFSTYSYIEAFYNLNIGKGIAINLSIVPFLIIFIAFSLKYIFSSEN